MASGGFFARMGNLWRGFLSLWVSGIEKDHPEIAYENALNGMVEKYTMLKKATAAVIRRRDDITARLGTQKKDLAQAQADLDAAIATNQDDLAMMLIQKKNQLSTDVAELEGELAGAAHHVAVGEHIAIRREEEAGAVAASVLDAHHGGRRPSDQGFKLV